MDVEHLWFSSQPGGGGRLNRPHPTGSAKEGGGAMEVGGGGACGGPEEPDISRLDRHPVKGEDMVQTLTMMADQRLYKLVKWCKSLPLFKNILVSRVFLVICNFCITSITFFQIDDQIALLINAWCELLVLSCCYRSDH